MPGLFFERLRTDGNGACTPFGDGQCYAIGLASEGNRMARVSITVNGKRRTADVEPRLLLVHFLREHLEPDRRARRLRHEPVRCLHGAGRRAGARSRARSSRCRSTVSEVTTIEGLADGGPAASAAGRASGRSTGCSAATAPPGMILSAVNLLEDNPAPTEQEIRDGLDGNLCRCTGYQHIVNAIQHAARADGAIGRRRVAASMTPAFSPASAELLCRETVLRRASRRPVSGGQNCCRRTAC